MTLGDQLSCRSQRGSVSKIKRKSTLSTRCLLKDHSRQASLLFLVPLCTWRSHPGLVCPFLHRAPRILWAPTQMAPSARNLHCSASPPRGAASSSHLLSLGSALAFSTSFFLLWSPVCRDRAWAICACLHKDALEACADQALDGNLNSL